MSYQKIYYDNNKKEILQQKHEYYIDNQTQLIDKKKKVLYSKPNRNLTKK